MAGHGGVRPNSGRKTKAEELKTSLLARQAIINKYGSLEKGLEWLLVSGEPSLIKFAFEHSFGKAPDKIEHSGDMSGKITLNIVRGKSNLK